MWQGSVGEDLQHYEKDRAIHTDPGETRRRRTIKLYRDKDTWGFTLQTYGIKNKKTNELEVMTYVDYVEFNGPAGLAGMRRGDVILSVNGETVEGTPHKLLVKKIQETKGTSLRLVVLFEDCCRKVELYERFIKLKQVLKMKLEEYRYLEKKEHFIMEGHGSFSRMSSVRSSLRSSSSSDWDRFSMVVSPAQMLQSMPSRLGVPQHFLFPRPYPSSQDDSSEISLNDVTLNDSFSDDNDAFLSASCSDIVSLHGLRQSKDSLSNRSVSSLITHADIEAAKEEKTSGVDVDNGFVKVESSDDNCHNDSGKVFFNIGQDDEGDVSEDNSGSAKPNVPEAKDRKDSLLPGKSEDQKMDIIQGDNSVNKSTSVEGLSNDKTNNVPNMDKVLGDTSKENVEEITIFKEEIPPPKKRFVKGVLVNDIDQVTKL